MPLGLLLGLMLLLAGPAAARAQAPVEYDISSFYEMQEKMKDQLRVHLPKLERIGQQITDLEGELKGVSELLKYPKNVPMYRDTAMEAVLQIRTAADKYYGLIQDVHFQWFPYWRELMAVYVRYGELKIVGKVDQSLREFLLGHREVFFLIEKLLKRVELVYNECDYLLNSKLN